MFTAPTNNICYDEIDGDTVIDVIEQLAMQRDWECNRVNESVLSLEVQGDWLKHSLSLMWSESESILRAVSTFSMKCPTRRQSALFDLLNRCNDLTWFGSFTWWAEQSIVTWRYACRIPNPDQIDPVEADILLTMAVGAPNRFVPAFREVLYNKLSPEQAVKFAFAGVIGRA